MTDTFPPRLTTLAIIHGALSNEEENQFTSSGIYQVSSYHSVGEFFENVEFENLPDLIVLPLLSDGKSTLCQIDKILAIGSTIKIIISSGYPVMEQDVEQAIRSGVKGFVLNDNSYFTLVNIFPQISAGGLYIDPRLTSNVIERLTVSPGNSTHAQEEIQEIQGVLLKPREMEVARGLIQGKQYKEIAKESHISVNTVRYYVKELYTKFGVHSRFQLIQKLRQLN